MFQVSKHSFVTKVCIFGHFENMVPINVLMFFWVPIQWGSRKFKKKYKILMFSEKCMEKNLPGDKFGQKNITVKKNVRLQFGQNQKFLIYKLFRLIFVTSCIEGIFDFSKIEAGYFFLQKKIFAASLFTRSNKSCIILGTTCPLLLF